MKERVDFCSAEYVKKLTEDGKWFEHIIENSFDGFYITDGEANTIMINKAYLDITGLHREDVLDRNMKDLEAEGIISASGSLRAISERRRITLHQEFKTGRKATITSTPIFDENDIVQMVVTNVRDLTELYNLQETVEEKKEIETKLVQSIRVLKDKIFKYEDVIAEDKETMKSLVYADKVAALDTTVILLGETGVGKEVFAKYIFNNSVRHNESFLKVNCGAIPENLLESELFGYEKGAFTGADKNGKPGLFEVADKGTVFLDEIGDLPLNMQVKLLRVLQEREFERIGGTKPIKVDVRIIAATNKDLTEMVEAGEFREDLYYRLMVFPINIPPLRNRTGDIAPLTRFFVERFNKRYGMKKFFSPLSLQIMKDYSWPGNIRELQNIVERAVIISTEDEITPESIPISMGKEQAPQDIMEKKSMKSAMEEIEIEYINAAYEKYGNVRDAAESLGMTASTFVRRRARLSEKS